MREAGCRKRDEGGGMREVGEVCRVRKIGGGREGGREGMREVGRGKYVG